MYLTKYGRNPLSLLNRLLTLTALIALLVIGAGQAASGPDTAAACDNPAQLQAQIAELYLSLHSAQSSEEDTLEALYRVGEQYQAIALECGYLPSDVNELVINTTDVERILEVLDTLTADPLRGQLLYDAQEPSAAGYILGCSGCHTAGEVAPMTEGTWTRWDEERSQEERFAEYDFRRYAVESIVLPWEYFVATYPEYTMPDFYHDQLSYQDLADLVIYLESQDQLP